MFEVFKSKYLILVFSINLLATLAACSPSSSARINTPNSVSSPGTNLGTLPDGSIITISSSNFIVNNSGSRTSVTGNIIINSGNYAPYSLLLSVMSADGTNNTLLPTITTLPSLCILNPSSLNQNLCQLTITGTGVKPGIYFVTPSFNGLGKLTTLNRFTITVTDGSVPTPGNLAILLTATSISIPNSIIGVISLTNSSGINSLPITIGLSNGSLATVSPSNCVLSSGSNSCVINITGVGNGNINITAGANGYTTAISSTINIHPVIVQGSLAIDVMPSSTIRLGSQSNAILTLVGSSGVENLNVSLNSDNNQVAVISRNSCILSSTSNSCNISVSGANLGSANLIMNANGYAPSIEFVNVVTAIKGNLMLSLYQSSLNIGATSSGTLNLQNSLAVEGLNVAIASNLAAVSVSPSSCTLSTESPSCAITVTGNSLATATISANANNYTTATITESVALWVQQTDNPNQPSSQGYNIQGYTSESSVVLAFTTGIQIMSINQLWKYSLSGSWQQIIGLSGQPTLVNKIYGASTTNSIIVSSSNGIYLWIYNGLIWKSIIGGAGQPQSIGVIPELANINSLIVVDNQTPRNLWKYDTTVTSNWQQLNGAFSQPTNISTSNFAITANSNPNNIIIADASNNLWDYNGQTWKQLMGLGVGPTSLSNNSPVVAKNLSPTESSIIVIDNSNIVWTYDGTNWKNLMLVAGAPNTILEILGYPTINSFIGIEPYSFSPWLYYNGAWTALGNLPGGPTTGVFSVGMPSPTSVILEDASSQLWGYNGTNWNALTGGAGQPFGVLDFRVFGQPPTLSSLVVGDNSQIGVWTYINGVWANISSASGPTNGISGIYGKISPSNIFAVDDTTSILWYYNGTSWSQLTGLTNQPSTAVQTFGTPTTNSIISNDIAGEIWIYSNP